MKKTLAKLFARIRVNRNKKWVNNPVEAQQKTFQKLIKSGSKTLFGADHKFQEIKNPSDFAKNVPVRDYEGLRSYIEKIVEGEEDILWPGKPIYFSKTSGTTSGAKYIPITKESMPTHINAALDALLTYINYTGKADFVLGKQIFIQGLMVGAAALVFFQPFKKCF